MLKKLLALTVVLALCAGLLSACIPGLSPEPTPSPSEEPTPVITPEPTPDPTPTPEPVPGDTLNVAYETVDPASNPFLLDPRSGSPVLALTQTPLLTVDRAGQAVLNAGTGATVAYGGTDYTYDGIADISVTPQNDGSAVYRITLREGVTFSDGTLMTADDVIFNYYVYLDPSYSGPVDLSSAGISGVREYRTRTPSQLYESWSEAFDLGYAQEGQETERVAEYIRLAWLDDVQTIVDYCMAEYLTDYAAFTGYTPEEISADEGLQILFAMWIWGFGDLTDDGQLQGIHTGTVWDLETQRPTLEDFYAECEACYAGDPEEYWRVEGVDNTDVVSAARDAFIREQASQVEEYVEVTAVSGIVRVDDRTVEITTEAYSAADLETLCGIYVAPLSHYGDATAYDYPESRFGFPFGDVSGVLVVSDSLGAGPYMLRAYEGVTASLDANPRYFAGMPVTEHLNLIGTGTRTAEEVLTQGIADIVFCADGASATAALTAANAQSPVAAAIPALDEAITYIGINAQNVKVGEESMSEESVALRMALATVLAAGREDAARDWYGDTGIRVDYPISSASWACPQGDGWVYSTDAAGEPLYTAEMTAQQRLDAATEAARTYLLDAGYTWSEDAQQFTEAPEGASLTWFVQYVGGGKGENPCAAMLERAALALYDIGITLDLNDLTYRTSLRETLNQSAQQIWVSTMTCDSYEELYRYFHSDDAAGQNYFGLASQQVDELILQIGELVDPAEAQALYGDCIGELMGCAVIIPCFQSYEYIVYSTLRLDAATLPLQLTPSYDWTRQAADIAMAPVPFQPAQETEPLPSDQPESSPSAAG